MSERPNCAVCDQPISVTWTDTHGVGACIRCALPYRIYHYEGDERVERPPSVAIEEAWLPLAREYWREKQRRVFPACYDMGIERHGRTYSGASREDCELFDEWMTARKSRWPEQRDAATSKA